MYNEHDASAGHACNQSECCVLLKTCYVNVVCSEAQITQQQLPLGDGAGQWFFGL